MKKLLVRFLLPVFLTVGFVGQASALDLVNDIESFTKLFKNKQGTLFDVNFGFELSTFATLSGDFSSILNSVSFEKFKIIDDGSVVGSSLGPTFQFDLPAGVYSLDVEGKVLSNSAGFTGLMSAAPVPEPAEWMMILAGITMMGFVVSRRRNG